MEPFINLKQFLAVLLLLVIPAALMIAYFRNYDPQAGGHQHSESAGKRKLEGADQPQAEKAQEASQIEALRAQFEAASLQFEASRMQFEASRKALEAVSPGDSSEKQPVNAPQPEPSAPSQQDQPSSSGHAHEH